MCVGNELLLAAADDADSSTICGPSSRSSRSFVLPTLSFRKNTDASGIPGGKDDQGDVASGWVYYVDNSYVWASFLGYPLYILNRMSCNSFILSYKAQVNLLIVCLIYVTGWLAQLLLTLILSKV